MTDQETLADELWDHIHAESERTSTGWLSDILARRGRTRNVEPVTGELRSTATHILSVIDPVLKRCWDNSIRASQQFDECQYVEGYIQLADRPPFSHAWVEVSDHVIELTMPERPDPPEDTVYIGAGYDDEQVERAITEQNRYDNVAHAIRFLELSRQGTT